MKTAALLALTLILSTTNAFAILGGARASTEDFRRAVHGMRKVTVKADYEVHEITTEGTIVREYLSSAGVVFCVAWNGISHPDLSQLFGPYYSEYVEADRSSLKPKGRAESTVVSRNLKVSRAGHMRAVRGRACIPALVPSGFDLTQIQ